jgi:Fe2+ transport system protein FeoA
LSQLAGNETANVIGFSASIKNLGRLLSFGLMPGCSITVLQNHGGRSMLVQACGMKIALDRNEAGCIEVIKS